MNYVARAPKGFVLPAVLAISLATLAIMTALLMLTSASYKGGFYDYYQKISDEAAEAGTAYATACLNLSGHAQTWGSNKGKNNLTPNSDCNGVNAYPSNSYVYNDSRVRTYFIVDNLDYSYQFSAQVSARGYAEVLRSDGSVIKTYTSIRKKVIVWPTDIEGQMSAAGTNRTCAIVSYAVYCWGLNGYGQLGDGRYTGAAGGGLEDSSSVDSRVPVKVRRDAGVMANKKVVKIFAAMHHSCALSADGLMYCWGDNGYGQLGSGTTTDSPVPVQVAGALAGKVITDIGGTNYVSCAVADGKIYCWGLNNNGLTGRGLTSGSTLSPTLVSATNTTTTLPTTYIATALATSGTRSKSMCSIANSKAYCWGLNGAGSLGDGTTTDRSVPTKVVDTGVLAGKTVTSISQDGFYGNPSDEYTHVCVVASGSAYCWGDNGYGQLGNDSLTDSSVPVAVVDTGVLAGKTIQDMKVGIHHSCTLADGGVYCWGRGNSGQVGDGSLSTRRVPVAVAQQAGNITGTNVVSIGAGANRGCAVVTDGRTFCWGLNSNGQVGDGTTTNRSVPTESLFLRPVGNQYIF